MSPFLLRPLNHFKYQKSEINDKKVIQLQYLYPIQSDGKQRVFKLRLLQWGDIEISGPVSLDGDLVN